MTAFSFWLNNFFKPSTQRNPLLQLLCRLAQNASPPASQLCGRPCGPVTEPEREWVGLEREVQERGRSQPAWAEWNKTLPGILFSISVSVSLSLNPHIQVYLAYRSCSDGHSLLPHSRLCYYDCEVLTEFDSGLHISFNMWWCEIDSYTFYSLTALWTLPPLSTLFSLFCFSLHFCLFRRQLFGCALYYCANCLHVSSFVSGCCLFCSVL